MNKPTSHFEEGGPSQEPQSTSEREKQERVVEILRLVEKINESGAPLPFPGIPQETYLKMKADENEAPGYTTPIDEIIFRCQREGIKVITGRHPGSGGVFILPAGSDDCDMDSILPRQLAVEAVENEHLARLIQLKTKN
ncbi:hypothetical protein HOG17_02005 [Candidatus Peregrinibacteria bacterium]|nr:hypothetical protein [Candidatus Peregrinibacteria bacterium]MBT4147794.1 hypothetical protein [Candidatus Peregrinibacteria bacterium]MBT4366313.1 hypothetical protein [Candidatus Peregrinibacteria bacterium]MBT4456520.1 hypothetical protein [Candidatus Peregrinibacteria bacterium]